jgi:hypothetical protein
LSCFLEINDFIVYPYMFPVISAGYLPTGGTAKNSEINIINGSPPPSDHLLGKVMINIFPPLERNHPSNLGSSLHKSALQILHSHHGGARRPKKSRL